MGDYFNLIPTDREYAISRKIFCVVIYDIISNKRRLKLARLLEGYGTRVQDSCFELLIEKSVYKELLNHLKTFYREDEGDSIIVYRANKDEVVSLSSYEGADDIEVLFL